MSTERRLVTLREISHLRRFKDPHYKAYAVATVENGWNVVVYHGDFLVGDLILFFEIDSFIPASAGRFKWEHYGSLTWFQGQRGYHVVSQALSKELSQGLIQRVTVFPEVKAVLDRLEADYGYLEGTRIARTMSFEEMLGVKKWEIPYKFRGKILGFAPKFFPRPASERAQNIPDLFSHKNLNTTFQITEKLDGVSMTVYSVDVDSKWHHALASLPQDSLQQSDGTRVGVASASKDLDERGNDIYWQAAKRLELPTKLREGGLRNVAIQGELIGPTIKNNSLNFEETDCHQFIVFQMFDINKQVHMKPTEVLKWCDELGLPHVPIIGYLRLKDFATSLPEILTKAEGVSMRGTTREGLVLNNMHRAGFTIKVISNKWLLEQGE